jgi:heat shock protein HslJ
MRSRLTISLLALVALAGLAACGSTSSSGSGATSTPAPRPGGDLAGTSWQLTSYQGPNRDAVPAAPGSAATLKFGTTGDLTGSTGCNTFSGTYTVDGQKLTIKLGPMTMTGCTGALLTSQENAVTQLLPTVTGFTAAGGKLTLTGADNAVLFTYGAGLTGLEGTSWTVTGVNTGNAVETTVLTENLTAAFGLAGAFSGNGGCNTLTGTYTTSGTDGLTITGLAGTSKACAPEVTKLETQYQTALGQVSTYAISGDTLTLRNSTGTTQATLRLAS